MSKQWPDSHCYSLYLARDETFLVSLEEGYSDRAELAPDTRLEKHLYKSQQDSLLFFRSSDNPELCSFRRIACLSRFVLPCLSSFSTLGSPFALHSCCGIVGNLREGVKRLGGAFVYSRVISAVTHIRNDLFLFVFAGACVGAGRHAYHRRSNAFNKSFFSY